MGSRSRPGAALVGLLLLAALPRSASAQPVATPQPVNVAAAAAAAAPAAAPMAVPIIEGTPAPFDGVLLNEPKATEVRLGLIKLTECTGLLEAKKQALVKLEQDLAQAKQDAETAKQAGGGNKFWWGMGSGLALSVVLVWGATNLLDKIR